MADRMRANLGAVNAGAGTGYDVAVAGASKDAVPSMQMPWRRPAPAPSDQLAADDLFDWLAQIQQTLPSGDGAVCIDSTPNDGAPGAPACDGAGNAYASQGVVDAACHAERGRDRDAACDDGAAMKRACKRQQRIHADRDHWSPWRIGLMMTAVIVTVFAQSSRTSK